jgi:hypothetical protein
MLRTLILQFLTLITVLIRDNNFTSHSEGSKYACMPDDGVDELKCIVNNMLSKVSSVLFNDTVHY